MSNPENKYITKQLDLEDETCSDSVNKHLSNTVTQHDNELNDALQSLVTASMICYRALNARLNIGINDILNITKEHGIQLDPDQAITVLGLTTIMKHLPPEVFITVIGITHYLMDHDA